MDVARKQEVVSWVSINNGSAVLTQSVETLHRRSLSFNGTGHHLRFISPTTDPRLTINQANKMGMVIDPEKSLFKGSVKVRLACSMSLRKRALDKTDPYTLKDYGRDFAQSALTTIGIAGVGLFVAGVTTSPVVGAVAIAGGVASGVGGMQTIYSVFKKLRNK